MALMIFLLRIGDVCSPLFRSDWCFLTSPSKVWASLNLEFFTQVQKSSLESGGGMKHSIAGSLMLILHRVVHRFAVWHHGRHLPVGVRRQPRWARSIRFAADVLNGVPSIIVGLFVYAIAVLPVTKATKGEITFSAWAGGLALGIMMIPTIMRTTEEIVKLVPMSLREGALALGDTRWHSVFKIVLASAKGGIVTGVLLAIARISGETAPLTCSPPVPATFFNTDPSDLTASLPVTIYFFATSPSEKWQAQAWGGALVLVTLIFVLSLAARYFTQIKRISDKLSRDGETARCDPVLSAL